MNKISSGQKDIKPIVKPVDPTLNRVFLQLIPPFLTKPLLKPMRGFGNFLLRFTKTFEKDLKRIDFSIGADDYLSTAFLNYGLIASILGLGIFQLTILQEKTFAQSLTIGCAVFALVIFLFMFIGLNHPKSILAERAIYVDKYLLYSLRDLSLQISSGGTIYDSLLKTAIAPYGEASTEFKRLVSRMYVGIPMQKVLRSSLNSTKSDFLRKVYWQLISSLESGADLRGGLLSIISELDERQKAHIQNYARELSLWSLLYMMFAVAVPTIGLTMMVILSAFAGFGLTQISFILFLGLSFCAQIALIYFVKARRPVVEF